MNNSFEHKIFQLRISDLSYKIDYLKEYIAFLKKQDFTMIYLDCGANFPFPSFQCLANDSEYSGDEIKDLCMYIEDLGMELMVTGLSFSHSGNFIKYDEFKNYAEPGTDNLELTDEKSLEIIIKQGEDILETCPSMKILHVGGDEMFNLGRGMKSNSYILKHGKSKLYVDFVNKIVEHFAKKNIKIAIWSDMIIRYYQDIDSLDKRVMIFYWDYWSYGERIPFMTIGGGCLDTFVLDRPELPDDLEKLLRWNVVRETNEIPIGHMEYFEKYYQMAADRKTGKAFPYLTWFKDKGFETICSFLSYTEKGSIFPNLGEKIEHIKGFLGEGAKCGANGYMFCLWQPHWPLLELYRNSAQSIKFIAANPEISAETLFNEMEKDSISKLSSDTLEDLYSCALNFEFSDTLNPFWGGTPCSSRIKMIKEAGWVSDENRRTRRVIEKTSKLLDNPEIKDQAGFLYFSLQELNWRAKCQESCLLDNIDSKTIASLIEEGESLLKEYRQRVSEYFSENTVFQLVKHRWDSLFELLEEIS